MEWIFWIWAAAVTVSAVASDVRISLLGKRLNQRPQEAEDADDATEAIDHRPGKL